MKTTYTLRYTLFTLFIFNLSIARAQVKPFERTFGGSRMDYGHTLARTADGGFILAGQSYSYGDTTSDTWLIKTDADGIQQWMKTMGSDTLEGANSIVQTNDGGYFVVNHTEGFGAGDCEAWMFRTDAAGNILWDKTYGGTGDDVGEAGIETSTGDFIATGIERIDDWRGNAFIAKYSSGGNTEWIKNYGGIESELGMRILEAADGGYVVAGTLSDTLGAPEDIFVFKTNSNGDLLWFKNYGGIGKEEAFGFCETPDGGYLVSGTSTSFGSGDKDAYLVKIDSEGNQQWSRNYGALNDDGIYTVAVAGDNGYIAAGTTHSFANPCDMLIIKTDSFGNQQWMKLIGSPGYLTGANWLVVCSDGGFAIVGNKQKVGSENGELYFIKTDSKGNKSLDVENLPGINSRFIVYPDPAINTITLSYDNLVTNPDVMIYNALGELFFEGINRKKINVGAFPGGIYFIILRQDDKIFFQRFIKI